MIFWRRKDKDETPPVVEETPSTTPDPAPAQPEPATPEPSTPDPPAPEPPAKRKGLFAKLKERLVKTKQTITDQARSLFLGGGKLDETTLERLEEILVSADVDMQTTMELVDGLRTAARRERKENTQDFEWVKETLKNLIVEQLGETDRSLKLPDQGTAVILIVGVNGSGKTTAIGKMAHRYRGEGKSVLLAAGDTFRAAAIEQLQEWGRRAGVEVVSGKAGGDPAAVVFDAVKQAKATGVDMLIIDTAGRLHTKTNLMAELQKVHRIIGREMPDAPHETLLVLDATTGQNGVQQAKKFGEATTVSGLILTKLDGTAKGGVTIAVQRQLGLPVKMIGVGESLEDLEIFDAKAFAAAILD